MKKNIILFIAFSLSTNTASAQKIFFSSIPKTGTHLLSKCLSLLTKKKGTPCHQFVEGTTLPYFDEANEFIAWHVPYSLRAENTLKNQNFKSFFIYRDPRDQVISYIFFAIRDAGQIPLHQTKKLFPMDFSDLLNVIIKNVDEFYRNFTPWINNPYVCTIKFEDLVGPKGGGDSIAQYQTIERICNHLGITPTAELIEDCIKNLFGDTFTFREGKIGSWKKHFSNEHKKMFKDLAGNLLKELKYEKDNNW